jgi:type IV pilus assembly protein PilY1
MSSALSPTDSDLGQGITDFGKRLAWQYVSQAWFNNTSPGKGYLHVPVALLDSAQAARINVKLGTSQFAVNMPTNSAYPLQNAGLTPLEGTVMTANDYFSGNLTAAAQGGPAAAPPNSCGKNFLVALTDGLPSVTKDGVASANVATNLSDLTTQVAALKESSSKAETYVVGFALPYGVSASQLDTIAAAGGSGTAYNANDTATLNAAFSTIFSDIIAKTAAASAVALNSQSVAANAHVFQAKFSSGDWSGQLLDYTLASSGNLVTPVNWDAGQKINSQAPDSRVILTTKPSLSKGVPFRWPAQPSAPTATELDASQSTALNTNSGGVNDGHGAARLAYLRGAADNEGSAGLQFRRRPTSKLGDIVNSAPHYVGVPSGANNASGYSTFRSTNAARTKMVYVGANDGMLHGFDAATGLERIAYVPSAVYGNLSRLTDASYAHRYFVDGSPHAGDAYYGSAWHTVLVGSMGVGAKGIFALDVTNPANFSESNAASLVNFEFTSSHDSDIGHVPGPVSIVKLNNGKWAALFGNGYNSGGSGESTLFMVDIQTGALIKKISTGAGSAASPNALATPLAIDADNNMTVDVVYAGDLLGNVWRFDLTSSNENQWKVDYKLFQAAQPITSGMDAGEHPLGGYMVYFGTGKYLEPTDVASTPVNTMYGIWDKGASVTGNLQQQVFSNLPDINGNGYRTATANAINWTTKKGWYANFPTAGERVVSDPVLRGGRVIVTSIIPSSAECSPGGVSWLNEVDWLTGGLLGVPPFDTNGDGVVNSSDTLAQGRRLNSVASAPAIQRAPTGKNLELKFLNESSGEIAKVTESANPTSARRLSWRQIK